MKERHPADKRYYIRFGDIPQCGRSGIYTSLTDPPSKIGYEKGVSVWRAVREGDRWTPVYPHKPTSTTRGDFEAHFMSENRGQREKILLVTGTVVGYGSDGEPLLRSVSILRTLSPDDIMDLKTCGNESKLGMALRVQSAEENKPERDPSLLNVRKWAEERGFLNKCGTEKKDGVIPATMGMLTSLCKACRLYTIPRSMQEEEDMTREPTAE